MKVAREDLPDVFVVDGSWRDIYVFATTIADWDSVLAWLQKRFPGALEFSIDSKEALMPESMEEILRLREEASPLLQVNLAGLTLNCHFFADYEIELDLDPRELTDDAFRALLGFMRELGELLRPNVYLTPENSPKIPLLVYHHEINRILSVSACDREEWES